MGRQLRLIWDLARNDWKLFLADRRAAALCFIVPILLASVFGLVFDRPSQRMGSPKLPLLVVVEDDTSATRAVVAELMAGCHVEARVVDRMEAERAVERRDCGVAVVFPTGFSGPGKKPAVELLHHPLAALESQWAEGLLTEVLMKRAAREYLAPMGLSVDAAAARSFDVKRATLPADSGHAFNAYSHSFSGMTLQYLLFWGLESGLLFLRERQRGLWRRMRAAPVPLTTALLGRATATAAIALAQIATTFAFGWAVFGVTIDGSWLAFIGLALGIAVLAAATGLCVAAVGGTEARARSVFIVVILALSMLSGLWLPAFLLPGWVREVAEVLPTTWAMRGLDGVTWQGMGFSAVWPSVAAVTGFTAAFFALAVVRFQWSESRRRRGVTA